MNRSIVVACLLVAALLPLAPADRAAAVEEGCTEPDPIDVGLVIDRSASMEGDKIEAARDGATRLAENFTARHRSGLVSYASFARLDEPLDADHQATIDAIADLEASGNTATGDGIDTSHDDFVENGDPDRRDVMILLTDGKTNTGSDPVSEANEAKADGIEIFAVGFGDDVDEEALREIVSEPVDEHLFRPATTEDLLDVFSDLTANLTGSAVAAEGVGLTSQARVEGDEVVPRPVGYRALPPGGNGTVEAAETTVAGWTFRARLVRSAAHGDVTPEVAHAHGSVVLEDLAILDPSGRTVLRADAIRSEAWTQARPDRAEADAGGTRVAGLTVAGQALSGRVPPDTTIPLGSAGNVTLNEQTRSVGAAEASLRVRGLHLRATTENGSLDVVLAGAYSASACSAAPSFGPPTPPDPTSMTVTRNYTAVPVPVAFVDISLIGTPLDPCDDCLHGPLPLGFEAPWYDRAVDEFWVSTNGFLTFSEQDDGCCEGRPLPTDDGPFDLVAGWWADLDPGEGGSIHYATLGETPDRVLVVQFTDVPHNDDPLARVTMQLKVFELDGAVEVHHLLAPTDGSPHTVGVQDGTGDRATEYHHGDTLSLAGHAVRFVPPATVG